jgi:SAM-dependent methyltransferase
VSTEPERGAFAALASEYDDVFTNTALGRALRLRVWQVLDNVVASGDRLLELSCGTGEDAVHLAERGVHVLATDASDAMVAAARAKAESRGAADHVVARQWAIEDVGSIDGQPFDAVLSNFGGVNCVADLDATMRRLADVVRPGGVVVLVVMGRFVPWEWAWFVARGEYSKAARRLRGRAHWRGMSIRYPTPRSLVRSAAAGFVCERVLPIGIALPPPYASDWIGRRPALLHRLGRVENVLARVPGSAWFGDHYLVQLRRTSAPEMMRL